MFDFWKMYRGSGFHHEDDMSNIENVDWKVHEDDNHRFAFHKNLLPVPYVGNPTKANILILMLNPGYSPTLSYPEESSDNKIVRMLKKNLQNEVDICWWLGKEWKDSGAGLYWRKAFGKIANELKKINGYSSLEESFSLLSDVARMILSIFSERERRYKRISISVLSLTFFSTLPGRRVDPMRACTMAIIFTIHPNLKD